MKIVNFSYVFTSEGFTKASKHISSLDKFYRRVKCIFMFYLGTFVIYYIINSLLIFMRILSVYIYLIKLIYFHISYKRCIQSVKKMVFYESSVMNSFIQNKNSMDRKLYS